MPFALRNQVVTWPGLCVILLSCQPLSAQNWATGESFRKKLTQPIGATWADTPLRDALDSLAVSHGVAIFLDRRVDPGRPITCSTELMPFQEMLQTTLQPLDLGVGFVGPVVYVGPRHTAARLATLAELRNEKARQQTPELRARLLQKQRLEWDELTRPRTIVSQLVEEAGLEFLHDHLIPHDLWRAANLPPMTIPERLTLVLAGFNMNFTIQPGDDGPQFRLTRFPIGVAIRRSYPAGSAAGQRIADIERDFPQAIVERVGNKISVQSLLEDHWQLEERLVTAPDNAAPHQEKTTRPAERAYTLTVENKPVGKVLEILAQQLGLTIEFDEQAAQKQNQLVTFSVEKASAQQLLSAAAAPAQLQIDIDGKLVRITRK